MDCAEVVFSGHAVQRMFARGLSEADILLVIRQAEIIESYPQDTPHPSDLLLGVSRGIYTSILSWRGGLMVVVLLWLPMFPTRNAGALISR